MNDEFTIRTETYKVVSHSDEEWGHEIHFDSVEVEIPKDAELHALNLINSYPSVTSVSLNIDKFILWKDDEKVVIDKDIHPTVTDCKVEIFSYDSVCHIVLDDNKEIFVACELD